MFKKDGFCHVFIGGAKTPRLFVYANVEDLLADIMAPGYFNKQKILLLPNSLIKVICKNAIAEIVVAKNTGDVTMRNEFFRATDPYAELKKPRGKPRRTAIQMAADKKKQSESLVKTG